MSLEMEANSSMENKEGHGQLAQVILPKLTMQRTTSISAWKEKALRAFRAIGTLHVIANVASGEAYGPAWSWIDDYKARLNKKIDYYATRTEQSDAKNATDGDMKEVEDKYFVALSTGLSNYEVNKSARKIADEYKAKGTKSAKECGIEDAVHLLFSLAVIQRPLLILLEGRKTLLK